MLADLMVVSVHIPEKEISSYERTFLYKLDVTLGHLDHDARCVLTKVGDDAYSVSYNTKTKTADKLFETKREMFSFLKMLKESA
jgi:hypothetical protein